MTTAVILAAGLGSRLNNKLKKLPKGFIEFEGQTLIMRSIDFLKSVGISKIILGTGYFSECYEAIEDRQTIFCVKNHLFANTGSFYTLCNIKNHLHEDFLLLESDLLYEKRALTLVMKNNFNDVILASSETGSGDEVFIGVDKEKFLYKLSKNMNDITHVYGELVGISKISFNTYQILCEWAKKNENEARQIHYEEALAEISDKKNIYVKKIDDLVWTEIDTKDHYQRAIDYVYPRLLEKEDE